MCNPKPGKLTGSTKIPKSFVSYAKISLSADFIRIKYGVLLKVHDPTSVDEKKEDCMSYLSISETFNLMYRCKTISILLND